MRSTSNDHTYVEIYDLFYFFLFSLYCRLKFSSLYWYIYFAYNIDKTNIIFHDNVINNWCNIDEIENNICSILRQYNIMNDHYLYPDNKHFFKRYIFGKQLFLNSCDRFSTLYTLINYHFLLNNEMLVICDHLLKCQI